MKEEERRYEEAARVLPGRLREQALAQPPEVRQLAEEFGGEVPGDFTALTGLAGVGRKTANVVLAEGFGVPKIAVDTHVFRVSNRIGLANSDKVLETEKQLMQILPEERWTRGHHLLIFHGRNCCRARKPNCAHCPVKEICRSSLTVEK